jgi:hypothetical protein
MTKKRVITRWNNEYVIGATGGVVVCKRDGMMSSKKYRVLQMTRRIEAERKK